MSQRQGSKNLVVKKMADTAKPKQMGRSDFFFQPWPIAI